MSKRQGIQELQARLAVRLASKDQQGALATWLAVEAGGQRFLLPLSQSGELFHPAPLVKVPYVQPWFLGLVNLRGALHGVVDLASLPWLGLVSNRESWSYSSDSRLIVLPNTSETLCAVAVDKVLGLKAAQGLYLPPDADSQALNPMSRRLIDIEGNGWLEIDLLKLSSLPEFLDIHARPVSAEH